MNIRKNELFSIPNVITYFRILLIPLFVVLYGSGAYGVAAVLVAVSGLTDIADGFIARKFHMITNGARSWIPLPTSSRRGR